MLGLYASVASLAQHHAKKRHASFVCRCTLVTRPIANGRERGYIYGRMHICVPSLCHAKEREQTEEMFEEGNKNESIVRFEVGSLDKSVEVPPKILERISGFYTGSFLKFNSLA